MSLTLVKTSGYIPPENVPLTDAAMRKAFAGASFALDGTVGNADLGPGAVTAAKVTPGPYSFASATLGGDTYAATFSPAVTSLAKGTDVSFWTSSANPEAPKFSPNGLTAKEIRLPSGFPLRAGQIAAGSIVTLRYDSDRHYWLLMSSVRDPYVLDTLAGTAGTSTAYTLTLADEGNTPELFHGRLVVLRMHLANTGAATININGMGPWDIHWQTDQAVAAHHWRAGDVLLGVINSEDGIVNLVGSLPVKQFSGVATGSANTYAVTIPGFPQAYTEGLRLSLKIPATNTNNSTLNVTPTGLSALGAQAILKHASNTALEGGELLSGEWVELIYTGGNWRLIQPTAIRHSVIEIPSLPWPKVVNVAHGLGVAPRRFGAQLLCKAGSGGEHGWAEGDAIDWHSVISNTTGAFPSMYLGTDPTNLIFMWNSAVGDLHYVRHKTTGVESSITPAKWQIRVWWSPW